MEMNALEPKIENATFWLCAVVFFGFNLLVVAMLVVMYPAFGIVLAIFTVGFFALYYRRFRAAKLRETVLVKI